MRLILLTILLITIGIQSQNVPSGIITVRPNVITKFKNWFLPQLLAKVGKPSFPEINGGGAKIRNLRVETLNVDVASTNIVFTEGILNVNILNLNICIKGDFEVKKGFIKIKGRIEANSRGARINLGYAFGLDAQNKLTLIPKIISADVNDFDLKISGNVLAQVVNFVKDLFKGDIKRQVNKHLQSALGDAVTDSLNKAFTRMNYQAQVFKGLPVSIDFQPSYAPIVHADRIEIYSNAYFFNNLKAKARPPYPLPQVPKDLASQEIQITFDEYFINSFFFAGFDANILQETINSEDVPKDAMVQLTTDGVGSFIPEVVEKYGEGKKMNVLVKASKSPMLKLTTGKAALEAQLDLEFFVRKTDTDVERAFSIKTNFVFAVTLRVEQNLIKGKILNAEFTFVELIDPKIVPFDPNVLKSLVNDALTFVIESVNEKQLSQGIPINNINNIDLKNTEVIIGEKFFRVLASPEFSGVISI